MRRKLSEANGLRILDYQVIDRRSVSAAASMRSTAINQIAAATPIIDVAVGATTRKDKSLTVATIPTVAAAAHVPGPIMPMAR